MDACRMLCGHGELVGVVTRLGGSQIIDDSQGHFEE